MTQYVFPGTTSEALELLKTHHGKARILAGGTDLMPDLRAGQISPEVLIDITRIKELQEIRVEREQVTIGAAVSFTSIKEHSFLKSRVPVLTRAAASIGAGGIQGAATLAGNIIQAMPAADGAIAALALESEALLCGEADERWIPVIDLYLGPGQSAVDPTQELIKAIRFPLPLDDQRWGTAWSRIGRRSALILPILNCAVKLIFDFDPDQQRILKASIALGPVGTTPLLANRTARFLTDKVPTLETFSRAGEIAQEEARPRSSPLRASREYRQHILPTLVRNTLVEAAELAGAAYDR